VSPFLKGEIDVRWDDPSLQHGNEGWIIRGVNIYRSSNSDRGPYRRVNIVPVGGSFYRDRIATWTVHEEEVQPYQWFSKGDHTEDPYKFKTKYPIAKLNSHTDPGDSPKDVVVTVDGQTFPVTRVIGQLGEVTLAYRARPADEAITMRDGLFPEITDTSVVKVSYLAYDMSSRLRVGPDKRDFYRVTTVASDPLTDKLYETPLDQCKPFSDREIEQVDYMWREGIRRNNWILEQGGERVKLFTRRIAGEPCFCTAFNPETLVNSKHPDSLCKICFGVGIKGGYDGPFDIIIGPDDAEKRVSQSDRGRKKEHSYEVWIGPSPIVSQRDFIVKMNNDRYSIGAVRYPSNRGNILQQHFNIGYLDSGDIRYKFPLEGVPVTWDKTQYGYWSQRDTYSARSDAQYPIIEDRGYPQQTQKTTTSDALEKKGRTATWENQNY
jgi:hypothetical protein